MYVFWLLLLIFAHGHGQNGLRCGTTSDMEHKNSVSRPQHYGRRSGRRLPGLEGGDSSEFAPASELAASGDAKNIRIRLIWETIQNNDVNASSLGHPAQCRASGDTYDYRKGSTWVTETCNDKDVVTTKKLENMQRWSSWGAEYWELGLQLNPVQDPISISTEIRNRFSLNSTSFPNADLVVIMTARPQPDLPIVGYASCVQRDQWDRCTVGQFNWVPSAILVEEGGKESKNVEEDGYGTAVHELVHLLGGVAPGPVFRDDDGNAKTPEELFFVAPALSDVKPSRNVTYLNTTRVLERARAAFGCDTLQGVPLEDDPIGRGAHWESRVFGPEVMSYGSTTGQIYVSELTYAFLEDTNQYVANYTNAGPLVRGPNINFDDVNRGLLTSPKVSFGTKSTIPPGTLRYGYQQGCSFVTQSPSQSRSPPYICQTDESLGCTFDRRQSSVCIIRTPVDIPEKWSCAEPTWTDPNCARFANTSEGVLPDEVQFFESDSAARQASGVSSALASNTGGFSSAMDFVPVSYGFWSCVGRVVVGNATEDRDGTTVEFGDVLRGAVSDISQFGGQSRCERCRCFESSLTALSRIGFFNPTFPQYGLCYASNCAKRDTLQVGIKNQIDGRISWYRCPSEGGSLWVTGFSGALTCPKSPEFCAMEDVSGVLYPETNRGAELLVYVVFGTAIAVFSLVGFCICSGMKDVRDRARACCGVDLFPDKEEKVQEERERVAAIDGDLVVSRPSVAGGESNVGKLRVEHKVLRVVSGVSVVFGLFLVVYTIVVLGAGIFVAIAVPILFLGLVILGTAYQGFQSSRPLHPNLHPKIRRRAPCATISYFFTTLVMVLVMLWYAIYLASGTSVKSYISANLELIEPTLPSGTVDPSAPREDRVKEATAYVVQHFIAVGVLALLVSFVFLSGLVASGRLLGARVVVSTTFTLESHIAVLCGLGVVLVSILFLVDSDSSDFGNASGSLGIIIGLAYGALGVTSLWVLFRNSLPDADKSRYLRIISISALVLTVLFLILSIVAFAQAAAVHDTLANTSTDQIATMQDRFGVAMSRSDFEAFLQNVLVRIGAGSITVAILSCLLGVAGYFYRKWMYVAFQARFQFSGIGAGSEREEQVRNPINNVEMRVF